MIRFTVSYPATPGASFDHAYYRDIHVPLCLRTWGLTSAQIDTGIEGPAVAAVHFSFPSLEAFHAAMASEGHAHVIADVANYTTITPVLQVSKSATVNAPE